MIAELIFRVSGCVPELWDPDSGRVTKPAKWRVEDGRTVLSIEFSAFGSLFVVLRPGKAEPVPSWARAGGAPPPSCRVLRADDAIVIEADQAGLYEITGSSGAKAQAEVKDVPSPVPLASAWTVKFPSGWGAPPETAMELTSWTVHRTPVSVTSRAPRLIYGNLICRRGFWPKASCRRSTLARSRTWTRWW
jgi:hypothetical protein